MRTPFGICSQFFLGAFALLMLSTSRADYLLGPNDLIRIAVYGNEDLATETRISDSGKITFPLLGEIEVGGLSVGEAETLIERLLSERGYVRDPQVNIAVQEYRSHEVAVLGFVNKPGRYALDTASTVTQLIALAGGVNPQGDDRTIVTRVRNGQTYREELNLKELLEEGKASEDILAEDGDVIFVPRAPVFYIHGEVQRPGAYRLERNMSVAQAISLGGGVTPRGSLRSITIKRRLPEDRLTTIDAELDELIQKDDVIYVGERWF
jgi:polysaccharide export outer membrane protein